MSRAWLEGERPPERVLRRELQGRRFDRVGEDGVDQPGQRALPARRLRRDRPPASARHEGGHRRPVAVEQPEDPRRRPGLEGDPEHLVGVGLGRPRGNDGSGGRRKAPGSIASRSSHSATAARAATQAASAVSAPIRAASASRLRRSSVGADRGRRRPFARRGRGRLARLVVDPVDLAQPVASRAFDRVGVGGHATGRPERPLRLLLGRADRPRVASRGRLLGRGLVRVVRPLGEPQRIGRLVGARPGAGGQLAALVGDPALFGAPLGRRPAPACCRRGPSRRGGGGRLGFEDRDGGALPDRVRTPGPPRRRPRRCSPGVPPAPDPRRASP